MALLCTLLSRLVVTAVGRYPHNLLSWSNKLGSCRCFRITVSPHHFPNEGEAPDSASENGDALLAMLAKDPVQLGPIMGLMEGGAELRSAWLRGQPSGHVLELGRKSPTAVPVCPLLSKPPLQGLCVQTLLLWGKTNGKTKQSKNPCKDQCK